MPTHTLTALPLKIDVPDPRYTGPEITDELFKNYFNCSGAGSQRRLSRPLQTDDDLAVYGQESLRL